ncbi:MAG: hypothetical protein ACRDTQ_00240 [Micromonosporaceae bacterium]
MPDPAAADLAAELQDSPRVAPTIAPAIVARGPIAPGEPVVVRAGWEVSGRRSTADTTLADLAPLTKVQVKATPEHGSGELLGVRFNQARPPAPAPGTPLIHLVVGAGPGEWLLLAPPGTFSAVVSWQRQLPPPGADLVTVTDLSHGLALLRLAGPGAADVLAALCPVDPSDQVTPDGAAFRSAVAGVAVGVARVDSRGRLAYLLHCERSSGQHLHDALLTAGAEQGLEVQGFPYDEWGDSGVTAD